VEVDETLVGGEEHGGKRGRGAGRKSLVAVAIELRSPRASDGYGCVVFLMRQAQVWCHSSAMPWRAGHRVDRWLEWLPRSRHSRIYPSTDHRLRQR